MAASIFSYTIHVGLKLLSKPPNYYFSTYFSTIFNKQSALKKKNPLESEQKTD